MRRSASAVLAVLAALALPAPAAAHARLVRTEPANGTVLVRAPSALLAVFDDEVRPGSGIEAIRNGGGSVQGGKARVEGDGRVLVIPLRRNLGDGDYSVRWAVVTDDGHELSGVVAFGVGVGRPPPVAALSAGSGVSWRDVIARWLLFAGILSAAGVVAFRLLVWRGALAETKIDGEARSAVDELELRAGSAVLLVAFVLAFLGASAAAHGGSGTRYGVANEIATVAAAAGATISALAYGVAMPVLWLPAAALAIVLVPLPTLAGHALDPDQPWLSPFADVIHLAAAAVWLGGLLSLVFVVPRAAAGLEAEERGRLFRAVARRTSSVALASVVLVSGTGLLRAFRELSSVSQLWTTDYGRALLAKTVLLGVLVVLGWMNRYRLIPLLARVQQPAQAADGVFARLRRNVAGEVGVFALLVVAIALLTDLAPGTRVETAVASQPPVVGVPPALPPPGALVQGGRAGELAVGLATRPGGPGRVALTATVVGQDGLGVDGLDVGFVVDGAAEAPAGSCGGGCYAASVADASSPKLVTVRLRGPGRAPEAVAFRLSERWPAPSARGILRQTERAFRSLRSLSSLERLASRPGNAVVARFQFVAPDRMSYEIRGGAQAVVIGPRRWDRPSANGVWRGSAQLPLSVPTVPWRSARDARLLRTATVRGRPVWVVSFLDSRSPAWYTAWIDQQTHRTLDLQMTAAAHFMRERYSDFDEPLTIEPPTG